MVGAGAQDAGSGLAPLSARQTERQVGHYVWLERRRFEVLGQAAASAPEPEAKVVLATHARHHAWHASLWEGHLPRRSGPGTTGLVMSADAGLAACLDALSGRDDELTTAELAAIAYRVVAVRAMNGYERHVRRAISISDGALMRTCRLVLGDQRDDVRRGEALLQSLLTTEVLVDRVAATCLRLEELLGEVAGADVE